MKNQPPIRLEQWVSLVLSLSSHRSQNEGHREFGARIVAFVFDELPSRHAADETARSYFDHVLAEVAWAVRGFSNVRDHYGRQVDSAAAISEERKSKAKRHLGQSPLASGSLAGKTLAVAIGAGGGAMLPSVFPDLAVPWMVVAGIVAANVAHIVIEWITAKRVEEAISELPERTLSTWSEDVQPRYERIVRAFCSKVIVIQRAHFPETAPLTEAEIDGIVQHAFGFGVQTSEHAPSGTGEECIDEPKRPVKDGTERLGRP